MLRRFLFPIVLAVALAACATTGPTSTTLAPATTVATSTTTMTTAPPATTTSTTAPDDGFPVTIDAANGPVTIESRPERIVSISPTATEMLFAVGAGPQVVAVDKLSNYPTDAPVSDLDAFQANVEAISTYRPDLVVLSFDPGDVVAGLDAVGIPALLEPSATSIDDVSTQIEQLGAATGHLADAAELVARMQQDIDRIVADAPTFDTPPTYYHELDPTLYTVTSSTFIGEVYGLLGLENVADPADEAGSGYPQLSAEYLIEKDPDLIFLGDTKCCGQTAETVAARPGWDELTAVRDGHVVELDDDIASRWGPRIVDLLATIAEATRQLEPVG